MLRKHGLALVFVLATACLGGIAGYWLATSTPTPGLPPAQVATPAPGLFLVATRAMPDPRFQRSVILLLDHDDRGTLGLIVNRPTTLPLEHAMPELERSSGPQHTLYFGGPVGWNALMVLVRSAAAPAQSRRILDDVYLSADYDTLERLLDDGKPAEEMHLYFGHAGWAPGQLDAELATGSWRLFHADARLVFANPERLWEHFMGRADQIMAHRLAPDTGRERPEPDRRPALL